jgi:hypothetical protein
MANNPETYDCRVALKNCFSVISECRRVAMNRLPVNFFVVMFDDMVKAMLDEHDPYSDIVVQAWNYRKSTRNTDPQFIDATMDIFDNTLTKFNIDDPVVSKVYREFLTQKSYIQWYLYYVVSNIKHLQ